MEVQVYVRNLSKATTEQELKVLFTRAGTVTGVEVIKDQRRGVPQGVAVITMSAQNEADKAVSMFNAYSFNDQELRVGFSKPREQRGFQALN